MNRPRAEDPAQAMQTAARFETKGDLAGAERTYRQIIRNFPGFHSAYHSLGLLALRVGKLIVAADLITQATRLDPNNARYHGNLCEILRQQKKLKRAQAVGKRATELDPVNPDYWYNLGLAYADGRDWEKAERAYLKTLQLNPGHDFACNNLGAVYEKSGQTDLALSSYEHATRINPKHAEAHNNAGAIYSERGDLDKARKCFTASMKANPGFIEPFYNLSSLKTFSPADPMILEMERQGLKLDTLPADAQIRYHFAMGKVYEDTAQYDNAFREYELANRMKFNLERYNHHKTEHLVNRIITDFTRDKLEQYKGSGNNDTTPVFIVGMPRSGTSLLEQVLDSHPLVYGAGELKVLDDIVRGQHTDQEIAEKGMPVHRDLGSFDFAVMAQQYLDHIKNLHPDARRITDKMPANFFYLGFIHLMFPRARVIHSMRDPMDSCFSCYSRLFNEPMTFSYNLEALGNYYIQYIRLMQHWHQVLPQGTILDIRYEDMVADLETQARRLIAFLGLEWHENCLKFYENKRLVKTASIAQVRKPIYSTSVARWQHFDKHLQPLLDIVGEYRTV